MTSINQAGIYMDHATARCMAFNEGQLKTQIIQCSFNHNKKEESLSKSESLMHNKEQQQQAAFYKRIGMEILKYDEVVLFGTTEAKNELFNMLQKDHHYDEIKIDIVNTDHLTDHQVNAFVMNYFSETAYSS